MTRSTSFLLEPLSNGKTNFNFRLQLIEALVQRSRTQLLELTAWRCCHCGQGVTDLQKFAKSPSGLTREEPNGKVRCAILGFACCGKPECDLPLRQRLEQQLRGFASSGLPGARNFHPRQNRVACSKCGKCEPVAAAFKKCSRCKVAFYCSKDCQEAHWKTHKQVCKKASKSPPGV